MSEEMRSCVTCVHRKRKCNGECTHCGHGIVRDFKNTDCKCLVCRDEESGKYLYYEKDILSPIILQMEN